MSDAEAELDALRVKVAAVEALIPADGSVYVLTTDELRAALGVEAADFLIIPRSAIAIERPKGGIEQARRNFMRGDPELYAYIEARVAARELQRGAGDASGAADEYGAANRLYANAARWEKKWRDMLPDGPS